jgi:hypothetical protein
VYIRLPRQPDLIYTPRCRHWNQFSNDFFVFDLERKIQNLCFCKKS